MRKFTWNRFWSLFAGLGAALFLLGAAGCATTGSIQPASIRPIPNNSYCDLDAEDTVNILSSTGISEEEILELGLSVRNAMARSGGVAIKRGDTVETVFSCQPPFVYITTSDGNVMVYDTRSKTLQ